MGEIGQENLLSIPENAEVDPESSRINMESRLSGSENARKVSDKSSSGSERVRKIERAVRRRPSIC